MSANARPNVMKSPETQSSFINLLRSKTIRGNTKPHRRMSCKDIGEGDCEGWLMKRTVGRLMLPDKWTKYWFVLKEKHLLYYKDPTDDSYIGRFYLEGFVISPWQIDKSKYAFRVFHPNNGSFYMASDRQQDMAKWMNHITAAILDVSTNNNHKDDEPGYHSGDDEDIEPDVSSSLRDPHHGISSSSLPELDERDPPEPSTHESLSVEDDDFGKFFQTLRDSKVGVLGDSLKRDVKLSQVETRKTIWPFSESSPDFRSNERRLHLTALNRTLKDKVDQLAAIDELFAVTPVTSDTLMTFQRLNPTVTNALRGLGVIIDVKFSATSDVTC